MGDTAVNQRQVPWIILVFLKLKLALAWIHGLLREEQGQLRKAVKSYYLQVVCILIGRQDIKLRKTVYQLSKFHGRTSTAWGMEGCARLEEAIFGQILEVCESCAYWERIMSR